MPTMEMAVAEWRRMNRRAPRIAADHSIHERLAQGLLHRVVGGARILSRRDRSSRSRAQGPLSAD